MNSILKHTFVNSEGREDRFFLRNEQSRCIFVAKTREETLRISFESNTN